MPAGDAALFAAVLSLDADPRHHAAALPTLRQKRDTIAALVGLVERLAGRSPTLLLFEDAHWADPSSLEVLTELVARVATMPALLIVTFRPEFRAPWAGAHVAARSLARLNQAESAALVARLTGEKALPPGLLEQIVAKADGVPLFVEELTKFLLESDRLHETAGRYEYAALSGQPTIPATLRDSLMARLDRVAPVKEIAQIGSAIGREFSYEMIAAIANMPRERLDGALAALTESGLAQQHRGAPDAAYSFKHALVQETAYESLLKGRRQELHRAIARVIEERYPALRDSDPGLLAHHLSAAGNAGRGHPVLAEGGEPLAPPHGALRGGVAAGPGPRARRLAAGISRARPPRAALPRAARDHVHALQGLGGGGGGTGATAGRASCPGRWRARRRRSGRSGASGCSTSCAARCGAPRRSPNASRPWRRRPAGARRSSSRT